MKYSRGPRSSAARAGDFVIAWESDLQDGGGSGVYAQRYSATGLPVGGNPVAPHRAALAALDIVEAWLEKRFPR